MDQPSDQTIKSGRRRLFRWCRAFVWLLASALVLVLGINLWVVETTQNRIFSDVNSLPATRYGIVLGTTRYLPKVGRENLHFKVRMQAAAAIYKAGKVQHLILSGDNGSENYNEPQDMRNALGELGVPASATTLDFAGFRTLDSIARAHDAGVRECIIVTEDFHLPRAIFLADHYGIKATGFTGQSLSWSQSQTARIREWSARILVLLDVYILRTEPKFSGEKIPLPP